MLNQKQITDLTGIRKNIYRSSLYDQKLDHIDSYGFRKDRLNPNSEDTLSLKNSKPSIDDHTIDEIDCYFNIMLALHDRSKEVSDDKEWATELIQYFQEKIFNLLTSKDNASKKRAEMEKNTETKQDDLNKSFRIGIEINKHIYNALCRYSHQNGNKGPEEAASELILRKLQHRNRSRRIRKSFSNVAATQHRRWRPRISLSSQRGRRCNEINTPT